MNARQTRAYIRRKAQLSGGYKELAETLTALSGNKISLNGVYQWYVRGVIPEKWEDHLEEVGE